MQNVILHVICELVSKCRVQRLNPRHDLLLNLLLLVSRLQLVAVFSQSISFGLSQLSAKSSCFSAMFGEPGNLVLDSGVGTVLADSGVYSRSI